MNLTSIPVHPTTEPTMSQSLTDKESSMTELRSVRSKIDFVGRSKQAVKSFTPYEQARFSEVEALYRQVIGLSILTPPTFKRNYIQFKDHLEKRGTELTETSAYSQTVILLALSALHTFYLIKCQSSKTPESKVENEALLCVHKAIEVVQSSFLPENDKKSALAELYLRYAHILNNTVTTKKHNRSIQKLEINSQLITCALTSVKISLGIFSELLTTTSNEPPPALYLNAQLSIKNLQKRSKEIKSILKPQERSTERPFSPKPLPAFDQRLFVPLPAGYLKYKQEIDFLLNLRNSACNKRHKPLLISGSD